MAAVGKAAADGTESAVTCTASEDVAEMRARMAAREVEFAAEQDMMLASWQQQQQELDQIKAELSASRREARALESTAAELRTQLSALEESHIDESQSTADLSTANLSTADLGDGVDGDAVIVARQRARADSVSSTSIWLADAEDVLARTSAIADPESDASLRDASLREPLPEHEEALPGTPPKVRFVRAESPPPPPPREPLARVDGLRIRLCGGGRVSPPEYCSHLEPELGSRQGC